MRIRLRERGIRAEHRNATRTRPRRRSMTIGVLRGSAVAEYHPMTPANLLVLMSDEHNPKFLGAAGHPFIATPNLDALAARGTRFASAYTTCPDLRAGARGVRGRPLQPRDRLLGQRDGYDGAIPSWHHRLRDAGHRVVSIGKLHFRGRPGDDHGFSEEIVPMHIVEGIGDVKGLVRENIPKRKGGDKMAKRAGPGESSYTVYDRDIAARAQVWLHDEAPKWRDRPWALFVSFVAPHFPLTAPPAWFYRYWKQDLPMPKLYADELRPRHPYLDDYANTVDYDTHFGSEDDVKRAIAGYAGLVSAMDENVGLVLRALEAAGLAGSTRVIYTSDHGDNLGARGLWGKSTLYEESAGVPLIMAGPDIAAGKRRRHAGLAHRLRADVPRRDRRRAPRGADALPGASLFDVANGASPARR
jgi:choline-sulfatase